MLVLFIVAIGAIALAHTAPFPFLLAAFAPGRSIWHMPSDAGRPPLVYRTYHAGPNRRATPDLLDVLEASGARATFFLIDAHLDDSTAPLVRRMFEEGHAVALHADTRALMIRTPESLAALLVHNADRIERLAGRRPCRLFR